MTAISLMLGAWAIEVGFGWPGWLFRWVRHPVVWIGTLISAFDQWFNHAELEHRVRYVLGMGSSLVVVAIVTCIAIAISLALPDAWWAWLIEAAIASSLLASRSLYEHVKAVAAPLETDRIEPPVTP